jgi:hypothetical protein
MYFLLICVLFPSYLFVCLTIVCIYIYLVSYLLLLVFLSYICSYTTATVFWSFHCHDVRKGQTYIHIADSGDCFNPRNWPSSTL